MHLWIPFVASVLFVTSLIFVNRLGRRPQTDVGPLPVLVATNLGLAVAFTFFWSPGGEIPTGRGWQPVALSIAFMIGLGLTFFAVHTGDVSVATPVFGVKVIGVPLGLWSIHGVRLPPGIWVSAAMATAGIVLIQWQTRGASDPGRSSKIGATIAAAGGAASVYAMIDVSLQTWSPDWARGQLLPITFWCVAVWTIPLAWRVDWAAVMQWPVLRLLIPGALLTVGQVICITWTLSRFGDATRVNVVYGLRGLWSVALAYLAAKIWGGAEADLSGGELVRRAIGAVLLTAAVVVAIV